MIELTTSNIEQYSVQICQHLSNFPLEEQVKAAAVLERLKRLTPQLVREAERLNNITDELERLYINGGTDAATMQLEREGDDCKRRGRILTSVMDQLFKELEVFLVNFSL
jgi:hypothetical protein